MTIVFGTTTPPCAFRPDVYHHEYLHHPPAKTDVSDAEWELLSKTRAAAHHGCAGCPFMVDCLYRAVVEIDVSGFVACTTENDRRAIRRQLGIKLRPHALTPFGAPRVGGGPLSHEVVMTMRQAYPKDSCQELADRLRCSSSTVKRHLRRAREQLEAAAQIPAPHVPSIDAVLDCFDQLATSKAA